MAFPVRLTAGQHPLEVPMEVRVLHREPFFFLFFGVLADLTVNLFAASLGVGTL